MEVVSHILVFVCLCGGGGGSVREMCGGFYLCYKNGGSKSHPCCVCVFVWWGGAVREMCGGFYLCYKNGGSEPHPCVWGGNVSVVS